MSNLSIKFIKLKKPRSFRFKARYYDEVKEEIKERTERIREELNESEQQHANKANIKRAFTLRKETQTKESTKEEVFRFYKWFTIQTVLIGLALYSVYYAYMVPDGEWALITIIAVPFYNRIRTKFNKN